MELDLNKAESIIATYRGHNEMVIGLLQDLQAEYNYLPRQALERAAQGLGLPLSQLYSIATFYKAFSLKPRGKHCLSVCLGTACHVRGGPQILDRLETDLGIKNGETTPDFNFTLLSVNCVGACALGPLVVVNGEYHGHLNTSKVPRLLAQYGHKSGAEGGKDDEAE